MADKPSKKAEELLRKIDELARKAVGSMPKTPTGSPGILKSPRVDLPLRGEYFGTPTGIAVGGHYKLPDSNETALPHAQRALQAYMAAREALTREPSNRDYEIAAIIRLDSLDFYNRDLPPDQQLNIRAERRTLADLVK